MLIVDQHLWWITIVKIIVISAMRISETGPVVKLEAVVAPASVAAMEVVVEVFVLIFSFEFWLVCSLHVVRH